MNMRSIQVYQDCNKMIWKNIPTVNSSTAMHYKAISVSSPFWASSIAAQVFIRDQTPGRTAPTYPTQNDCITVEPRESK